MATRQKRIAVVGGGLVGALNTCFFAKRGFQVDLYESRKDPRQQKFVSGRSINMALSRRGLDALKAVGLEDGIISIGIPMYARMIHDLDGTCRSIPYGKIDQYILAISRKKLNEVLLIGAEKFDNVMIHFEHKLQSCNFDTGEMVMTGPTGQEVQVHADLIVGCDGAYSAVRWQIMKHTMLDFSQEYIPHGYMELCIPCTKEGKFAMPENYLHIWPRYTFMMTALPNPDNSFTATLHMPFDIFKSIKTEEELFQFFENTFPDSIPLLGREALRDTYFSSTAFPMISVKCSPYHVKNKAVIMGDAAHAMVPFYGQGANCGLEDCLVFHDLMDKFSNNFDKVLPAYTEHRNPDAQAICDLSMYNYIEMRSLVNSPMFLIRKKLDNILYWLLPNSWIPLYTMVAFTRTRYHECIKKRKWQDKVLHKVMTTVGVAATLGGALLTWKFIKNDDSASLKDMLTPNVLMNKLSQWNVL